MIHLLYLMIGILLVLYCRYTDIESEDNELYKGLVYLLENNVDDLHLELNFTDEALQFGQTITTSLLTDQDGAKVAVTELNKQEYVALKCAFRMESAIKKQLAALREGFFEVIPREYIQIFNEQELELLISGLPQIDVEDLRLNTEYHKYTPQSIQIQWLWRALRSCDQADRARFLQFVTGTSKGIYSYCIIFIGIKGLLINKISS